MTECGHVLFNTCYQVEVKVEVKVEKNIVYEHTHEIQLRKFKIIKLL
jgi:hypothetical protein